MMFSYPVRIVKEEHIDDGSTLGMTAYVDEDGNRWVSSGYSKENAPTGVRVGTMRDGKIYV